MTPPAPLAKEDAGTMSDDRDNAGTPPHTTNENQKIPPARQATYSPSIPPRTPKQSKSRSSSPIKAPISSRPKYMLQFGPSLLAASPKDPCRFLDCTVTTIHEHTSPPQICPPATPINQSSQSNPDPNSSEKYPGTLKTPINNPYTEQQHQRLAHQRTVPRNVNTMNAQMASFVLQAQLGIATRGCTGGDEGADSIESFGDLLPAIGSNGHESAASKHGE